MNLKTAELHPQWSKHLGTEFELDYMLSLSEFLQSEKALGKVVYPLDENLFTAFNATPLKSVRVVILGQDPYHGADQAHGLSFSVMPTVKTPPSLRNIYQELSADLGVSVPGDGYLMSWAQQGVLLLNAVLSVEQSFAGSHQGKGWEHFTDKVIELVNAECDHVVFMLWGAYAQKKGRSIDPHRHLVLSASHPSPLSAYRGFFGCRHFSKANDYLENNGKVAIDWSSR
ncbi:MAG: uracil-DNA glycosylase [Arenicella sp.]|jgi:uracil-DNA glycosylase